MVGSRISSGKKTFWGWFFIATGSICLPMFFFAAVVSKLLPPSDNPVIAAVQNDSHYYLLVPLTLPVLVVPVYFHWLSMHEIFLAASTDLIRGKKKNYGGT
ncbi:hypothetical protein SLE2022_355630 [Rubroshorea leprosula]